MTINTSFLLQILIISIRSTSFIQVTNDIKDL